MASLKKDWTIALSRDATQLWIPVLEGRHLCGCVLPCTWRPLRLQDAGLDGPLFYSSWKGQRNKFLYFRFIQGWTLGVACKQRLPRHNEAHEKQVYSSTYVRVTHSRSLEFRCKDGWIFLPSRSHHWNSAKTHFQDQFGGQDKVCG